MWGSPFFLTPPHIFVDPPPFSNKKMMVPQQWVSFWFPFKANQKGWHPTEKGRTPLKRDTPRKEVPQIGGGRGVEGTPNSKKRRGPQQDRLHRKESPLKRLNKMDLS